MQTQTENMAAEVPPISHETAMKHMSVFDVMSNNELVEQHDIIHLLPDSLRDAFTQELQAEIKRRGLA